MAMIGVFHLAKDGGWTGTIRTLTLDLKARFVPNDNRSNEAAPAFRVFTGDFEIGAAWRKQSVGEQARDYLSVSLDDPMLAQPISAALFEATTPNEYHLVWNRKRSESVGTRLNEA